MAAITSAQDGIWSDTATWTGAVVPGEGDTVIIQNTHDVEFDADAFDSGGDLVVGADTTTAAIRVDSGGVLFVANTITPGDYVLTCKGDFKTDGTGGTIRIGTAANPIPIGTTFTVKLNYSASLSDGEFGLIIAAGGTFTCQGSDRWSNGLTDPDRTLITTDAAVNDTHIHVADSTNWTANDRIYIASTTRTYSECEPTSTNAGQVDSVSGTQINIKSFGGAGGGLAYAHSGTSPNQAEVINLTRNVIIENYDGGPGAPGNVGYISFATTSTVDIDWTEFRYLGTNATDKEGIKIKTTSGSCNINRCSFHDGECHAFYGSGATVGATLTNNVVANIARHMLYVESTTTGTWSVSKLWGILGGTSYYAIYLSNCQFSEVRTFSDCRFAGTWRGLFTNTVLNATFTGLYIHANQGYAYDLRGVMSNITFSGCHVRRNGTGIYSQANLTDLSITDSYVVGNGTGNIFITNPAHNITISGLTIDSEASYTTATGLSVSNSMSNVFIYNTTSGSGSAHTSQDIYFAPTSTIPLYTQIYGYNVTLSSSTPITDTGITHDAGFVNIAHYGGTSGLAGKYFRSLGKGVITAGTTYYRTASPSVKITPSSATIKIGKLNVMKIPVASGANPTVGVYLRKSAAYNGNQPRLIVKRNDALGITADTVMATFAGANDVDVAPGTFTLLSGQPGAVSADGVIECYVDCDGTAGYINICDWKVKGAQSPTDNLDACWDWGLPYSGLTSRIKSPFTPFGG